MPTNEILRKYLRENRVEYSLITHPVAFTAQEVAHAVRVTGYELAKVVVLHSGGTEIMAVLPAPLMVDVEALREFTGIPDLVLESEESFTRLFPDAERGAMHPFGNLYGLPVWVEASLEKCGEIVFNACTHRETITMAYDDYIRLVRPSVASFGMPRPKPSALFEDEDAPRPRRRAAGGAGT
jgi:Ala-tRNA(Pro) deacylase